MWKKIAVVATALTSGLIGGLVATPLITGAAPAPNPGPKSVLVSITPARLLDSRPGSPTVDGQFQGTGKLSAGGKLDLTVNGRAGVPANATAVVLNVTATNPSEATFLTLWPTGATQPLSSNLNPTPGQPPTPNLVTVGVGTGGMVSIFNFAGAVDILADVTAYYVPANDRTDTLGIPGASWIPDQVAAIAFSGPCANLPGGNASFRTPVELPQGSTVTKVAFSYRDTGPNTTSFTLFKSNITTGVNDTVVPSTPVATTTNPATLSIDITPPVTLGPGVGLYARVVLDATSFVCGVQVTYQPPA